SHRPAIMPARVSMTIPTNCVRFIVLPTLLAFSIPLDRDTRAAPRSRRCSHVVLPSLKRGADREVEIPRLLPGTPVQVEAIIHPDRPDRRHPPNPRPRRVVEIGDVELLAARDVRPPHVADVDKGRRPDAKEQRHRVLDVAEQLDVAADLGAAAVLR